MIFSYLCGFLSGIIFLAFLAGNGDDDNNGNNQQ